MNNPLRFVISSGLAKPEEFILPEHPGFNIRFMKPFQKEAYDTIHNADFAWLSMPTGSGKSSVGSFVVGRNLSDDPNLLVIIVVPQLSIAKGFRHYIKKKITRFIYKTRPKKKMDEVQILNYCEKLKEHEYVDWVIGNDLTQSAKMMTPSTVKSLEAFLDVRGNTLSSRKALCTHQTIVALFKKLKANGELDKLSNIKIIIDEAHHILDSEDHGLGDFVCWMLKNGQKQSINLLLMTATPFRGDMRRIIPDEYRSFFRNSTYNLPFDKYMQSMEYLKSFDYQFSCYDRNEGTSAILEKTLDGKHKKTLIFLPRRTQGPFSTFPPGKKSEEVQEMVRGICRSYGWTGEINRRKKIKDGKEINTPAIYEVQVSKNKWVTIVDLVDDNGMIRTQVKKYLDEINDREDFADYIITLEIGKEGFDWQWCDQVVIFGKVGSLTQLVQIGGRALRDIIGKLGARILHFLPIDPEMMNNPNIIEDMLNDVHNAVCLSMLMYEIMEPIEITVPKSTNPKERTSIPASYVLNNLFDTEESKKMFYNIVQNEISSLQNETGESATLAKRVEIVSNVMRDIGISQNDIDIYAVVITKYLRERSQRFSTRIIEGLENNPILAELKERFGFGRVTDLSSIPENCIAAWTANQTAKSLSAFHKAMDRILGKDQEREELEKLNRLKAFLQHNKGRYPSVSSKDKSEAELAQWYHKRRNHPYHKVIAARKGKSS